MLMKFIGTNHSMGFVKDRVYDVKIKRTPIWIELRAGRLWCPYGSEKSLYKNWENIK